MQKIDYIIQQNLEPYVNCIMVDESRDPDTKTSIPIYADGYPGIMFQQSEKGLYLLPRNKKLSELFLYGQTVDPISLDTDGPFQFVVVQLYPFASKYLLGVDPKILNDDCFDLLQLKHLDVNSYHEQLKDSVTLDEQVKLISSLMLELIEANKVPQDDRIQQAIQMIIKRNGHIKLKELQEELIITERTFERNFISQVGLTPKQFAKIIQFQTSLHKLTQANFDKLTELSTDSGFADQSHFIRTFKKYTGQTPSYYLQQIAAN
jgi:AraC-like DNA-binding protein